jgi:hypothetical protein
VEDDQRTICKGFCLPFLHDCDDFGTKIESASWSRVILKDIPKLQSALASSLTSLPKQHGQGQKDKRCIQSISQEGAYIPVNTGHTVQ